MAKFEVTSWMQTGTDYFLTTIRFSPLLLAVIHLIVRHYINVRKLFILLKKTRRTDSTWNKSR